MEKSKRMRFTGKGPFSSINLFTTRIRTVEAVKKFGLGGDAANDAIDNSEDPKTIEGILNYHRLAAGEKDNDP